MTEVLLVEDEPTDVELLQLALTAARAPVSLRVVEDGEQALAYLRRLPPYADAPRPDLILLDLNLPRMDGRAVLAALKSDAALRSIPVVVLTTSESPADVRHAYDLGASAYLTKPMGLDGFRRMAAAIQSFWFVEARLPPREL